MINEFSSDNPDFIEIREEFLCVVRQLHRDYNYLVDPKELCDALGIQHKSGQDNTYTNIANQHIITYEDEQPKTRLAFSLWHEISHSLFRQDKYAFHYLLEEKFSPKISEEIEEKLCDEAAAILLIPDHILETACKDKGYCPDTIFHVSNLRNASLWATIRRLIDSHSINAWGVIIKPSRTISYSYTNTRFNIGKDFPIPENHPILDAAHGYIEKKAKVPYRSKKGYPRNMRASSTNKKIVGLFVEGSFPILSDTQGTLF